MIKHYGANPVHGRKRSLSCHKKTAIMENIRQIPQQLDEILIGQIIFDHSEWVSLWGYMIHEGRKEKMDFVVSFELFNKLLRLSGEEGDRIQMLVVEKIETGIEEPTVIDLEDKYGKPLCLNQCRLEVGVTGVERKEGGWIPDPGCLSIEEVTPLIDRVQAQPSRQLLCRQNLTICHRLLANSYKLYLGYRELGFDDEVALQKAELTDDLKFRMAYFAWDLEQASDPM